MANRGGTLTRTITIDMGEFTTVTPGVILQVREVLQRETLAVIKQVEKKQPNERYVVKVDGKFGPSIDTAIKKIEAFWEQAVDIQFLKSALSIIQEETYKFPKKRTGRLGRSWEIWYKSPAERKAGGRGSRISSLPDTLLPGAGITFINIAPYGSLMSRWSAVQALKGSLARTAAKAKPGKEGKYGRRIKAFTRTILYRNTPAGYSTVTRAAKRIKRGGNRLPLVIRAFDLAPAGMGLVRVSGVSVTALANFANESNV